MNSYAAIVCLLVALAAGPALGQRAGSHGAAALITPPDAPALLPNLEALQTQWEEQGWMLRGQSTFVQQAHPAFRSPYKGENSMQPAAQGRNTTSFNILLGRRLWRDAEIIIEPQISRGYGLSGTRGIAAFPNGEAFRIGSDTPSLYVSRVFLRQTIALSEASEEQAHDPLRFRGPLPRERITLTAGKFPIFDIFDDNRWSHDPRSHFMNWAFASAAAFDFANDAKGYTNGIAAEWDNGGWGIRAGAFQVARYLNSLSLDPIPIRGHQLVIQLDRFFRLNDRPGAIRLIGGLSSTRAQYLNALTYGDIEDTGVSPTGAYTRKKMAVVNLEQEVADHMGVFARASFNDGRIQQWMYTEMNWAVSAGLGFEGARWGRAQDTAGIAGNIGGLQTPMRRFLEAGGIGFITGDGKLTYRPEVAVEAYYAAGVAPGIVLTGDVQWVANPAYNTDRGPIWLFALRARMAF